MEMGIDEIMHELGFHKRDEKIYTTERETRWKRGNIIADIIENTATGTIDIDMIMFIDPEEYPEIAAVHKPLDVIAVGPWGTVSGDRLDLFASKEANGNAIVVHLGTRDYRHFKIFVWFVTLYPEFFIEIVANHARLGSGMYEE